MRTFDRAMVATFGLVAVAAFGFGVGIIIYAHTTIEPSFERLNAELVANLTVARQAVGTLEDHQDRLGRLDAPADTAAEALLATGDVLGQAAHTTRSSAKALEASADTLRQTAGDAQIVLSEHAFHSNAEAVDTAAKSLGAVAPRLDDLRQKLEFLAHDARISSGDIDQLRHALADAEVTLTRVRERLDQTQEAIDGAELPVQIARQVSLQGGLYILLSMLLLGMAGIWKRLSERT